MPLLQDILLEGLDYGQPAISTREPLLGMLLRQSPYVDTEVLERQILSAFRIHCGESQTYVQDAELIRSAIAWLKELYGNSLRKDGKTPSICHMLSVARDAAVCGMGMDAILLALFHDVGEDYGPQKISELNEFHEGCFNIAIGSHTLASLIEIMTFRRGDEEYGQYLQRLYSYPGTLPTYIKSFDGLENAKTIPNGLEPAAFESHKEKAMLHCRMWKKLNHEVYSYMLHVLHSKGIGTKSIEHKSVSQPLAEQTGVKEVRARKAASGELIMSLPDEGSNVITVYAPFPTDLFKNPQLANSITFEYSSAYLPQHVFLKFLKDHFGSSVSIEELHSLLPPLLRNRNSYFYQIETPYGFDENVYIASLRHIHKLALGYPLFFFNSPALFCTGVRAYDWLWKEIFYRHPKQ